MSRHAGVLLAALVAVHTLSSVAEAEKGRSVLLLVSDNQNSGDVGDTEVRAELSGKLVDFLKRTGDPWLLRHEVPRRE